MAEGDASGGTAVQGGLGVLDRALLSAGALGGPLFVVVFTLEGATRDGYDWRRHPVSGLALGPGGWMQAANFTVTGALLVAGAAGLWRDPDPAVRTRVGRALLALNGAGVFLAGVFTTEPVSGYPPGTPGAPASYGTEGLLHDLVSLPTFLGLPLATLLFARSFGRARHRGWAAASVACGAAMFGGFVLASAGFSQNEAYVADGGGYQRLAILAGLGWVTAVTARQLSRRTRPPALSSRGSRAPHGGSGRPRRPRRAASPGSPAA
jgi:hypothetical membrane protein